MASAASQLRRAALPSLPRRQLRSTRARALQCVCFIGPNQLGAIFSAMRAIVPKPLSQQGLGKVSVFASVTTAALASGGGGGTTGGSGWGDWGGNGGGDGPASSSSGPAGANPVADVSSEDMVEELILLDVGGMKCGGCVGGVKRILESQPGVTSASVNLATETALVRVLVPRSQAASTSAGGAMSPHVRQLGEQLAQALTNGGFKSTVRDPQAAGGSVAARLAARRRVKEQKLHEVTWNLVVAWALSAVSAAGHLAHAWSGAPQWLHALHAPPLSAALSVAALLGPGRDIIEHGARALVAGRPDMNTLVGLGATASFGVSCVAAALPALGWKTFFEEPAMLLGFVLIGRALEERAKLRASSDMTALQELVPSRARVPMADGTTREVPCEAVSPGDELVVLPGDRVPVDGVVVSGRTTVNESALTGEPLPLVKAEGCKVTAGTLNCDGTVRIVAERSGEHTVIADIVKLVETAQARTAPIQRLADAISGKFAFGVMAAAAATFAFWSTVGTAAFPQVVSAVSTAAAASCCQPAAGAVAMTKAAGLLLSAQLACNVLVTACPCALGLATPTAVLVGTAAGARRGLLVRGGDILEAMSQVDTVVFDKTGTLTTGRPAVTRVIALAPGELPATEVLALAAAVEANTTHPVAKAVVAAAAAGVAPSSSDRSTGNTTAGQATSGGAAAGKGSAAPKVQQGQQPRYQLQDGSFKQEPGSGVVGTINGATVSVGTLEWVAAQGAQLPPGVAAVAPGASAASADQAASGLDAAAGLGEPAPGHTRVYVALGQKVVGAVDIADQVRDDARQTVLDLQRQGLRTIMLSGDRAAAAKVVAAAVGIDPADVYAGVKPAGKAAVINDLKGQGRRVAMVGDGVNDTAALASAHVGMAMSGGVDAAADVAKVVLTRDQVHQVVDAVELSRRTMDKIRQNLWWAFGYNVVAIPLAAGALLPTAGICLTPSISGALMGLSSVAVVANSLLLQLDVRGMSAPHATAPVDSAASSKRDGETYGSPGGVKLVAAARTGASVAAGLADSMEKGTLGPKFT